MPLQSLQTLASGKAFEYKYVDAEEIIVYTSDDQGRSQKRHAIVITSFEQEIVRDAIKSAGVITVGASRDKPPKGSLGAMLKAQGASPQILSYLCSILVQEKFCLQSKHGNALAVTYIKTAL